MKAKEDWEWVSDKGGNSDEHGFLYPCGFVGMGSVGVGAGGNILTRSIPAPVLRVCGYPLGLMVVLIQGVGS